MNLPNVNKKIINKLRAFVSPWLSGLHAALFFLNETLQSEKKEQTSVIQIKCLLGDDDRYGEEYGVYRNECG